MGAPEVALLKLFQGPVIRKASVYAHVVQESIMPVRRVPEGIENFDKWFGVYPLLLFPIRVYKRKPSGLLNPAPEDVIPGENYGLYVDIGAYGAPRAVKQGEMWDAKKNVRDGEHWTRSVHGFSAPYTDIMCTRKEFRMMYVVFERGVRECHFSCLCYVPQITRKSLENQHTRMHTLL